MKTVVFVSLIISDHPNVYDLLYIVYIFLQAIIEKQQQMTWLDVIVYL